MNEQSTFVRVCERQQLPIATSRSDNLKSDRQFIFADDARQGNSRQAERVGKRCEDGVAARPDRLAVDDGRM
jgi:hypothetical protein